MPCNFFSSDAYDLFALGVLDDTEADEIRRHLRDNCTDCISNFRESLERVSQIALTAPLVQPARATRDRIIGMVKPAPPVRSSWLRFVLAGAATAACGVAVGIGLTLFGFNRTQPTGSPIIISRLSPPPVPVVQLPALAQAPVLTKQLPGQVTVVQGPAPDLSAQRTQIAGLEAVVREKDEQLAAAQRQLSRLPIAPATTPNRDVAEYQTRIDRLTEQVELYKLALEQERRELNRNVQLVSLLTVPDVKMINLASTEQGGGATARALVTARSAVFVATRLPGLQPGRSYQLWLMRRSAPAIVSGGVFRPDQTSGATFEIKDAASLAGLTAMAVTEEPVGGNPLPTGHKILVGLVKG